MNTGSSAHTFSGTHLEIGQQYGEACRSLIVQNLEYSYDRLRAHTGVTRERVQQRALLYQPYVVSCAPFLDEEVRGLAAGANLSLNDAYFLQLRAELEVSFMPESAPAAGLECTTFAVRGEATRDGKPLAGQNADLPAFYAEVAVVAEFVTPDQPAVLMLTPAGQLSYIGMNDRGVCAFANYIVCGGWRTGYPRYFLSRLALTQSSVQAAEAVLAPIHRASSRNVLLLDAQGAIADTEFAVARFARLDIPECVFVHSNHFLSPALLDEERASPRDLRNSNVRLERLCQLLHEHFGQLDTRGMQEILRDRDTYPDTLSIEPGDDPSSDYITITSLIAEPTQRRLWATIGPPSLNAYHCYGFSAV